LFYQGLPKDFKSTDNRDEGDYIVLYKKDDPKISIHSWVQQKKSGKQCSGSALILCGSGSSFFGECGSGSRFENECGSMRIRILGIRKK
jgi:hypothetical protein